MYYFEIIIENNIQQAATKRKKLEDCIKIGYTKKKIYAIVNILNYL